MHPRHVIASVLIVSSIALSAAAAVGLQPGKYEVTTQIEMTVRGTKQSLPPERPTNRCVTAAELGDPEAIFNERAFTKYTPDPKCTERNVKTSAAAVSYDLECDNRTVHVEATLTPTSYNAVRSVTPKADNAAAMTYKTSGKRTGECGK